VVNPLGVAEPTVGWKRAPLSAVVPYLVFFLIRVYISHLGIKYNGCMLMFVHL
jgi:hypothetical protein